MVFGLRLRVSISRSHSCFAQLEASDTVHVLWFEGLKTFIHLSKELLDIYKISPRLIAPYVLQISTNDHPLDGIMSTNRKIKRFCSRQIQQGRGTIRCDDKRMSVSSLPFKRGEGDGTLYGSNRLFN